MFNSHAKPNFFFWSVWSISFPEPAILCRKPGIQAKIELRIPFQRPIRFLPETDYPRASRSFPRIVGSGNEIGVWYDLKDKISFEYKFLKFAFFLKKKFSFLNFKTTKNMAV
jgi:hypothetical protein